MENNAQCIHEDTIDLHELLAILKKRRKLIWLIAGFITLIAIMYVFIAKPIYEAKTIVELAQINKQPIKNPNDLKEKLEFIFDVNEKNKKIELPIVKSIELPKKSKSLLVITTNGYSNSSAKKKLEEVVAYLSALQNKELNIYIQTQMENIHLIKRDLERYQTLVKQIEKDIADYKEKLLRISKEDAALAGIYSIEIGKKQTELNSLMYKIFQLKNQLRNINLSISPLNIQKSSIVGKVEVLDHPIKPKKKLIITVAFITGLMLSVFLAFFLEFVEGFKEKQSDQ
ncbi:Wzz/FepE/Etk N-terminal domain-containing protein [Nitratifractor salsuginis]|uniref:Lipopolysaccharide biosynthesis protein n=1 Tax=Nitratifractor salsuginis (strain DSM 16511 / JCM 12458 / E9I37-1) TaxID=749222 RepID=E6WZN0_NITSE|nr:Wzz/FepE/Etk N-terminal domain-containing protein [Nitratifractor salsuginis]ADV46671.1 lipopolysaccharide biosynthesis protein [Nitratifractor salsuginis DSM 16511]